MLIERCNKSDLADVVRLERECIECPWSEQNVLAALQNENCIILKATENGQTVGYCGVEVVLDEGNVLNVAVSESFRRRGIATALMTALENSAKSSGATKLFLEVNENNQSAISLYEKQGYAKIAVRRKYYGDDSAIIMQKTLA